jgi:hypothetical protein
MISLVQRAWFLAGSAMPVMMTMSILPAPVQAASESSKKEARVTRIIHEVELLHAKDKAEPASVNDKVGEDTGVRTGDESRSELTFVDLTITRLGSNTIFSFNKAGRSVKLNGGALLLRVPKESGGAQMHTSACSVAISGTTVVLETTRAGRNKLYVLEGGARMALNKKPGEWSKAGPGQMIDVPSGASSIPSAQNFDVDQFMNSNPLITDFPPLPSRNLIYASRPVYDAGPTRPSAPFIRLPLLPVIGIGGGGGGGGYNPPRDGDGTNTHTGTSGEETTNHHHKKKKRGSEPGSSGEDGVPPKNSSDGGNSVQPNSNTGTINKQRYPKPTPRPTPRKIRKKSRPN